MRVVVQILHSASLEREGILVPSGWGMGVSRLVEREGHPITAPYVVSTEINGVGPNMCDQW